MASDLLHYRPHPCYILLVIVAVLNSEFTAVIAGQKCWRRNWETVQFENVPSYPEIQVTKLIPSATARRLDNDKARWNTTREDLRITVPTMLETLTLQCSAKYRVQWGFESFPVIIYCFCMPKVYIKNILNENNFVFNFSG